MQKLLQFMPNTARLVTADELLRMPDDDYRYELVKGRVIRMPPPGFEHGRIVLAFGSMLRAHAKAHGLGDVVVESGCKLESNPDTVRGPDLSFVRHERTLGLARGYVDGGPDLVVEVLSPDDRPADVREKIAAYLSHEIRAVVVIDPRRRTVAIHRSSMVVTLRDEDDVRLDDVLAGFSCRVTEIFA